MLQNTSHDSLRTFSFLHFYLNPLRSLVESDCLQECKERHDVTDHTTCTHRGLGLAKTSSSLRADVSYFLCAKKGTSKRRLTSSGLKRLFAFS